MNAENGYFEQISKFFSYEKCSSQMSLASSLYGVRGPDNPSHVLACAHMAFSHSG